METNFSGDAINFSERIKWLFSVMSFLSPMIPSYIIKEEPWNIILTSLAILLPFLVELSYKLVRGFYFWWKLAPIISKKNYKLKAIGMFIDDSFKREPNKYNNKVKISNEYESEISVEYHFWKSALKFQSTNKISEKNSSTSISKIVKVVFESKKLIKISYDYENKFIDNKDHISKSLNQFNGVCNLYFNEIGEIIDYYYSSDGKNRFSFCKEWKTIE